jgi:hypothetical protein
MTQATQQQAGQVRLENIRFSFTDALFDAKQVQGQGDAKFSCTALLPRDHPQLATISATIHAVAVAKWGAKADEVLKALKAGDRLAVHDGDAKSQYEGYAGNYFINASNKMRPLVIGPQREPLVAADGKPYSGSHGNMIVQFWAMDNQFGKRVNASLLGVQFIKDGERLAGGSVAAADDFEAIPPAAQATAAASGAGAASLF